MRGLPTILPTTKQVVGNGHLQTDLDGKSSRRRDHSRRPLTPPYVRFRIRRFMLTLELLMTLQQ